MTLWSASLLTASHGEHCDTSARNAASAYEAKGVESTDVVMDMASMLCHIYFLGLYSQNI
jgi:hypothetical protein